MESLNDTDWRILQALQRNARMSYAELARAVKRISGLGSVTTSVVYSSPLMRRALTAPELPHGT
jgi:DNA-binding Lrp family transcriptional regulator